MISPKEGYLLALQETNEGKTASGLRQTDKVTKTDRPEVAEIVSSGIEGYKTGQRVIYIPFAAHDITYKSKDYLIISEDDILGTIE